MKKVLAVTVVLVAFFLVMNANAVDWKGKFALSAGGGVALPMGDFGDFNKMGFGGGVEGEYFVMPKLSIGANFTYNTFKPKEEFEDLWDSWTLMQYGVIGKYYFVTESKFFPFLKLGANANTPKVGDESGDTKIGVSVGAGAMYQASEKVLVGVEAMFHDIFTEGSATQYVTIYGKVTFFLGK